MRIRQRNILSFCACPPAAGLRTRNPEREELVLFDDERSEEEFTSLVKDFLVWYKNENSFRVDSH